MGVPRTEPGETESHRHPRMTDVMHEHDMQYSNQEKLQSSLLLPEKTVVEPLVSASTDPTRLLLPSQGYSSEETPNNM